jgi:hypothetical protein
MPTLALIAALAALSVVPAAASADDADLACRLAQTDHGLEKAFGLPHVLKEKHKPGYEDSNGAFTSSCTVYLYAKKPKPGVDPFGRYPKFKVRKGFASLQIVTAVQQDGPEGDNWDPDAIRTAELAGLDAEIEAGNGHLVPVPPLGATFLQGWVSGSETDNARGLWQEGEQGIVTVSVHSHGEAVNLLRKLAPGIVYSFDP